jgi:hypothetical protein
MFTAATFGRQDTPSSERDLASEFFVDMIELWVGQAERGGGNSVKVVKDFDLKFCWESCETGLECIVVFLVVIFLVADVDLLCVSAGIGFEGQPVDLAKATGGVSAKGIYHLLILISSKCPDLTKIFLLAMDTIVLINSDILWCVLFIS